MQVCRLSDGLLSIPLWASSFFAFLASPLWQSTHSIVRCGSLLRRSLSTRYPLYLSFARTGGGAPAHPSPSLAGRGGGLCNDFISDSSAWHVTHVLGVAAKMSELQNVTRNRARQITKGFRNVFMKTSESYQAFKGYPREIDVSTELNHWSFLGFIHSVVKYPLRV